MNTRERIMAGKLFTDMCEGMPRSGTAEGLKHMETIIPGGYA